MRHMDFSTLRALVVRCALRALVAAAIAGPMTLQLAACGGSGDDDDTGGPPLDTGDDDDFGGCTSVSNACLKGTWEVSLVQSLEGRNISVATRIQLGEDGSYAQSRVQTDCGDRPYLGVTGTFVADTEQNRLVLQPQKVLATAPASTSKEEGEESCVADVSNNLLILSGCRLAETQGGSITFQRSNQTLVLANPVEPDPACQNRCRAEDEACSGANPCCDGLTCKASKCVADSTDTGNPTDGTGGPDDTGDTDGTDGTGTNDTGGTDGTGTTGDDLPATREEATGKDCTDVVQCRFGTPDNVRYLACVAGKCGGCTNDNSCVGAGRPLFCGESGECVTCVRDANCAATDYCQPDTQICVSLASDLGAYSQPATPPQTVLGVMKGSWWSGRVPPFLHGGTEPRDMWMYVADSTTSTATPPAYDGRAFTVGSTNVSWDANVNLFFYSTLGEGISFNTINLRSAAEPGTYPSATTVAVRCYEHKLSVDRNAVLWTRCVPLLAPDFREGTPVKASFVLRRSATPGTPVDATSAGLSGVWNSSYTASIGNINESIMFGDAGAYSHALNYETTPWITTSGTAALATTAPSGVEFVGQNVTLTQAVQDAGQVLPTLVDASAYMGAAVEALAGKGWDNDPAKINQFLPATAKVTVYRPAPGVLVMSGTDRPITQLQLWTTP